jgi:hypothetical protein
MLAVAARVGRILLLALVPILTPVFGAPTSVDASLLRRDRLRTADNNASIRTVTVEVRAAISSTLSRVPIAQ